MIEWTGSRSARRRAARLALVARRLGCGDTLGSVGHEATPGARLADGATSPGAALRSDTGESLRGDLLTRLATSEVTPLVAELLLRTCASALLLDSGRMLRRLQREPDVAAAVERAVVLLSVEHPLVRHYLGVREHVAAKMLSSLARTAGK